MLNSLGDLGDGETDSSHAGAAEPHDFDYIVIGSGFGGSVSAFRLTEKGYSVGVMELGWRWKAEDFPKSTWESRRWIWRPGLRMFGLYNIRPFRHRRLRDGGVARSRRTGCSESRVWLSEHAGLRWLSAQCQSRRESKPDYHRTYRACHVSHPDEVLPVINHLEHELCAIRSKMNLAY